MMRYNYGFGFIGMGLAFLISLAILALLIVGAVYAVRALKRSGGSPVPPPPSYTRALDILNERYARGEITEEEYKKMRENIRA